MMLRMLAMCAVLLAVGACSGFGPNAVADQPSIAGQYELVAVDGQALPCCARTDSAGAQVTILGGSLTLGEAAPEPMGYTPAGLRPLSCIHAVANGAHIDTNNVVTLPDSSTYQIPPCQGKGTYTMVVTRRYDHAGGTSNTASDTSSNTYAWSDSMKVVFFVGSGLVGPVTMSPSGVDVEAHAQNFGRNPPQHPSSPAYYFSLVTR